jgi:hypothetical protein
MSYIELGARGPVTGVTDMTGRNPGNWTIALDPAILSVSTEIRYFEVYKMIVHGAPGSTFDVYVENHLWDTAVFGFQNSWDPIQPLKMQNGQTLYFQYSDPTSDGLAPNVTVWLRYDLLTKGLG